MLIQYFCIGYHRTPHQYGAAAKAKHSKSRGSKSVCMKHDYSRRILQVEILQQSMLYP